MFSPDIVCSEEFLSMPVSSRDLYFQLSMRADDDGFVQPRIIMRSIGSDEDDLRVLVSKRFVLAFGAGVVVIKHWLIHNMIRQDRYKPTRFQDEKKTLFIKQNKAYTDTEPLGLHSGNHLATQVRLGKDSNDVESTQPSPLETTKKKMEYEYEPTDSEGNPIQRNSKGWEKKATGRVPRNREALALVHRFGDMAVQKLKLKQKPVTGSKDYLAALKATSTLSEKQIENHMKDWFGSGQPAEHLIHFSKAFSINQINTVIGK